MLESAAKIFTVSQVNRQVRRLLESEIGEIWVEGEISNLRKQASGHQYFTLKDEAGQLSCVLFRGASFGAPKLADGQHVQAFGKISVYEARGQYQLTIQLIQPKGLGALQARFEALKRKLQAEGLFDSDHKKSLPRFPKRIGLVTSPTGAAVRDMLNILERRAPWIEVVIYPVRVQGEEAAGEIAAALNAFPQLPQPPDVVVVTRGGGSLEDLWAFNEEVLARAIHACPLPVVSAVGHEIDFTISDFAADLRAPTPSAAAELITPDRDAMRHRLEQQLQQIGRRLREVCGEYRSRLRICENSVLLREPPRRLEEAGMRLDDLHNRLTRHACEQLREARATLDAKWAILREQRPDQRIASARERLQWHGKTLITRSAQFLQSHRSRLREASGKLHLLGPQATLERGYTMTLDENGKLLRSAKAAQAAKTLKTIFADGETKSEILKFEI